MTSLEGLIERLNVITEYMKPEFERWKHKCNVETITEEAVLIDGYWIPLSEMKRDNDNNIYVKRWFIDKNME